MGLYVTLTNQHNIKYKRSCDTIKSVKFRKVYIMR